MRIQSYFKKIKSTQAVVRWDAAAALAFTRDDVVPELISALQDAQAIGLWPDDPDGWEGSAISWALGSHNYPEQVVPHLVRVLETSVAPRVQQQAAHALYRCGSNARQAVDCLTDVLAAKYAAVRRDAARALGAIGYESYEAVRSLIRLLLEDSDESVRAMAAEALGSVCTSGNDTIRFALEKARSDEKAVVKLHAAVAENLIFGNDPTLALDEIRQLLRDEDGEVRKHALFALWRLSPLLEPPAGISLLPYLEEIACQDTNWVVRQAAVYCLGSDNYRKSTVRKDIREKAVDAVERVFRGEEHCMARSAAAWTLGKFGDAAIDAIPDLINVLKGDSDLVRMSSARALGRIGLTEDAILALTSLLNERVNLGVLVRVGFVLAKAGARSRVAVPEALALLESPCVVSRLTALHLLRQIGESASNAVGNVAIALKDNDGEVKDAAMAALLAIGLSNTDVKHLVTFLHSGPSELRIAAARTLGSKQPIDKDTIRRLVNALRDDDRHVRSVVADVLRAIGAPAVKPLMANLFAKTCPDLVVELLKSMEISTVLAELGNLIERLKKQKRSVSRLLSEFVVHLAKALASHSGSANKREEQLGALGKLQSIQLAVPVTFWRELSNVAYQEIIDSLAMLCSKCAQRDPDFNGRLSNLIKAILLPEDAEKLVDLLPVRMHYANESPLPELSRPETASIGFARQRASLTINEQQAALVANEEGSVKEDATETARKDVTARLREQKLAEINAIVDTCRKELITTISSVPDEIVAEALDFAKSSTWAIHTEVKESLVDKMRPIIIKLIVDDIPDDYEGKRNRATLVNGLLTALDLGILILDKQNRGHVCSMQAIRGRQSDEKGYLRLMERVRTGSSQKSYPMPSAGNFQVIETSHFGPQLKSIPQMGA